MANLLRCRFCVLAMESVATAGGGAVLVCMECAPAEGNLAVAARGSAWHGIGGRGAVMMASKPAEVRRGGVKPARVKPALVKPARQRA